ncbi:MAG TPA: MFS transporter, partial [Chloroflexota bacterium]|nr:MFS transporter [Chloroflexota bacterium]
FPLWGGVVADRASRVRILYMTQIAALLLAALLGTMTVAGVVQPGHILLFSFLNAAVLAFDNPARQALVPELVERDDLVNAATLNNWAFSGATLVGPALAAAALPFIGIGGVFYLNAASFGAVIVALALMRSRGAIKPLGTSRQTLVEGLRYVRRAPAILSLVLMAGVVSLLGRSYAQLMPIFARDFLGLGVSGMSLLYTAAGGWHAGRSGGLTGRPQPAPQGADDHHLGSSVRRGAGALRPVALGLWLGRSAVHYWPHPDRVLDDRLGVAPVARAR